MRQPRKKRKTDNPKQCATYKNKQCDCVGGVCFSFESVEEFYKRVRK